MGDAYGTIEVSGELQAPPGVLLARDSAKQRAGLEGVDKINPFPFPGI
jgi:hypothetical protein